MIGTLTMDFEKRHSPEFAVRCTLTLPATGFRVLALFGPSGCGKTTILRCLAGLTRPDSGSITAGTDVWFDARQGLCHPPQRRRVGMLFQDYALFPHMTAAGNIAYGLRGRRDRAARVAELVRRFHLQGLEHRAIARLSGGEQQRVALARTIAPAPGLLLLDEPLSALDTPTRRELRGQLREMLSRAGVPVILVTHDDEEVRALADEVCVMSRGEILRRGPVAEVFSQPGSAEVARIVGHTG